MVRKVKESAGVTLSDLRQIISNDENNVRFMSQTSRTILTLLNISGVYCGLD